MKSVWNCEVVLKCLAQLVGPPNCSILLYTTLALDQPRSWVHFRHSREELGSKLRVWCLKKSGHMIQTRWENSSVNYEFPWIKSQEEFNSLFSYCLGLIFVVLECSYVQLFLHQTLLLFMYLLSLVLAPFQVEVFWLTPD